MKEEEKELGILKEFATPELSEEEIEKIVSEIIKRENATSQEIDKVMKAAMKRLKGRASGERVREIYERLLQSKK